jgi:hypothetical protein
VGCVLRIVGERLEVDRLLGLSTLTASRVWRRGEERSPGSGKLSSQSAINVAVGDADLGDFESHIQASIRFLEAHQELLSRLREEFHASDVVLDFAVSRGPDVAAQTVSLPPRLLRLAGACDVGIDVSVYSVEEEATAQVT